MEIKFSPSTKLYGHVAQLAGGATMRVLTVWVQISPWLPFFNIIWKRGRDKTQWELDHNGPGRNERLINYSSHVDWDGAKIRWRVDARCDYNWSHYGELSGVATQGTHSAGPVLDIYGSEPRRFHWLEGSWLRGSHLLKSDEWKKYSWPRRNKRNRSSRYCRITTGNINPKNNVNSYVGTSKVAQLM